MRAEQMTAAGVSYRQLDYWTTAGYLRANGTGQGPGRDRSWAPPELLVARLMAHLVDNAGLTVEAAHRVARGSRRLAPGVTVRVDVRAALAASNGGTATRRPPPAAGKGEHVVGDQRQALTEDLVKRYSEGESIRELATSTGRSYGFVHRVLTDAGVELRARGGAGRLSARAAGGLR